MACSMLRIAIDTFYRDKMVADRTYYLSDKSGEVFICTKDGSEFRPTFNKSDVELILRCVVVKSQDSCRFSINALSESVCIPNHQVNKVVSSREPLDISVSPISRIRLSMEFVVAAVSGFGFKNKGDCVYANITGSNDIHEHTTHFVTSRLRITEKAMLSLIFGCVVVSKSFFLDICDRVSKEGIVEIAEHRYLPEYSDESKHLASLDIHWDHIRQRKHIFENCLFIFHNASQLSKLEKTIAAGKGYSCSRDSWDREAAKSFKHIYIVFSDPSMDELRTTDAKIVREEDICMEILLCPKPHLPKNTSGMHANTSSNNGMSPCRSSSENLDDSQKPGLMVVEYTPLVVSTTCPDVKPESLERKAINTKRFVKVKQKCNAKHYQSEYTNKIKDNVTKRKDISVSYDPNAEERDKDTNAEFQSEFFKKRRLISRT